MLKQAREVLTARAMLAFLLTVITSDLIRSGVLFTRYFQEQTSIYAEDSGVCTS
jgi:hypothetical protein